MKLTNRLLPLLAVAFLFAANAPAKDAAPLHFLGANEVKPAQLLPPPPLTGSAEQEADLETVRRVFQAASTAEKQAAYAEKEFTVFNFSAAVGSFFTATNLPKTAAFFEKVHSDADALTGEGKKFFQRPRPFITDTNLINGGKMETSFGYPSGHSTESMTLALVLIELFPEKREAILEHARLMGWHRVQIARHYPTDIYAGRVLAQAIVRQMKKNEDFAKQFSEVQKEIAAARTATMN